MSKTALGLGIALGIAVGVLLVLYVLVRFLAWIGDLIWGRRRRARRSRRRRSERSGGRGRTR
jgi:hypothetical protein